MVLRGGGGWAVPGDPALSWQLPRAKDPLPQTGACFQLPRLGVLGPEGAQEPPAPCSPVEVPSLHDTDVGVILLLQARPLPTGRGAPIAAAIAGHEAGGQFPLEAPGRGQGSRPLVCQPPPVLGRGGEGRVRSVRPWAACTPGLTPRQGPGGRSTGQSTPLCPPRWRGPRPPEQAPGWAGATAARRPQCAKGDGPSPPPARGWGWAAGPGQAPHSSPGSSMASSLRLGTSPGGRPPAPVAGSLHAPRVCVCRPHAQALWPNGDQGPSHRQGPAEPSATPGVRVCYPLAD